MKARGCHAETDLGNMSNLLCDLHHMADKLGILWQCVLNVAEAHYVKETAPPKTKQPTKKSKA